MTIPSSNPWHKLDRERTVAMIDGVRRDGDHILFSLATSEAKCAKLPFYKNLLLYRLTNYASLPSFSFDYLGDGKTYFHLDGSVTPIYAANDTGNLVLTAETVVAYVSFFFNHVSGPDGDIHVIADMHDHPVLDTLDLYQAADLSAQFQPPEVHAGAGGGFTVRTTLFYLGSLVRATVEITPTGRIEVGDFQMLMSITPDSESAKEAGLSS